MFRVDICTALHEKYIRYMTKLLSMHNSIRAPTMNHFLSYDKREKGSHLEIRKPGKFPSTPDLIVSALFGPLFDVSPASSQPAVALEGFARWTSVNHLRNCVSPPPADSAGEGSEGISEELRKGGLNTSSLSVGATKEGLWRAIWVCSTLPS